VLAPCTGFPLTYPAMLGAYWSTVAQASAWPPFDPSLQPPSASEGPICYLQNRQLTVRLSLGRSSVQAVTPHPSHLVIPSSIPADCGAPCFLLACISSHPCAVVVFRPLPHHVVAERTLTDVWLACADAFLFWLLVRGGAQPTGRSLLQWPLGDKVVAGLLCLWSTRQGG